MLIGRGGRGNTISHVVEREGLPREEKGERFARLSVLGARELRGENAEGGGDRMQRAIWGREMRNANET